MTYIHKDHWVKTGLISILGFTSLSLGACSTTSVSLQSSVVPITYKVDEGKFKPVSIQQPYAAITPRAQRNYPTPRSIAPSTRSNPYISNLPKLSTFDQSGVDTDLYAHQRIGKTYTIMGKSYTPKHQPHYNTVGTASWYGDKFHGRPTATGELYDMDDITAAHKTLPLNSMVYVTNLETGKGLMVRVNDRGPFVDGRIIDLSRASARRLDMFTSGLSRVRVQYAGPADPMAAKTNKRPIKRPTTPQIRKNEAPALVAELPKQTPKKSLRLLPKLPKQVLPKVIPDYKSLRDLGQPLVTPPAAQASLPVPPEPKEYNNPLLGLGDRAPYVQEQPNVPQSVQTPDDHRNIQVEDGPITLTIKGPIHMASDKQEQGKPSAKFIPAVNYSVKPSKK